MALLLPSQVASLVTSLTTSTSSSSALGARAQASPAATRDKVESGQTHKMEVRLCQPPCLSSPRDASPTSPSTAAAGTMKAPLLPPHSSSNHAGRVATAAACLGMTAGLRGGRRAARRLSLTRCRHLSSTHASVLSTIALWRQMPSIRQGRDGVSCPSVLAQGAEEAPTDIINRDSSSSSSSLAISPSSPSSTSESSRSFYSSLLIALLVNYSVIISDWWQFKHTARDRFLAYVASLLPFLSPLLSAALSLQSSLLSSSSSFLLGPAASYLLSTPGLLRRLGGSWFDSNSTSEQEDGEARDLAGATSTTSSSSSFPRGSPPVAVECADDVLLLTDDSGSDSDGSDAAMAMAAASSLGQVGSGLMSVTAGGVLLPQASGMRLLNREAWGTGREAALWGQREEDAAAEEMRRPLESPGFSFSAAGLLFPYHLGVTEGLLEEGLITERTPLAGSSAGAIVCATVHSGVSMRQALQYTKELARDCRQKGTVFRLGLVLRDVLEKILPEDAHLQCSGRIRVAVTQVFRSPRGLLVDAFHSRQDLIEALITSSFVPGYLEARPVTRFRGRVCVDGGLSLFMPPTAAEDTVRVCAFPASALGLSDIAISPDLNPENQKTMKQLFTWALEPAEDDILDEMFEGGKRDALTWLKNSKCVTSELIL